MAVTQIDAYDKLPFTAPIGGAARTFDVYRRGQGAPVVVIQELPGIGQETLAFADRLVAAGFQVWAPHLFGPIGRTATLPNIVRVFCMRREFQIFSRGKSSAVVDWLRALCRHVKDETGASGVGVVGMCLTGNFALVMIAEPAVLAAVAAEPSLPPPHMSDEEIAASRAALDAKGPMLAYRFEDDSLCTAKHFASIDKALNDGATRIRLKTLPSERPKDHSVFTIHFRETGPTAEALADVTAYFKSALKGAPA